MHMKAIVAVMNTVKAVMEKGLTTFSLVFRSYFYYCLSSVHIFTYSYFEDHNR